MNHIGPASAASDGLGSVSMKGRPLALLKSFTLDEKAPGRFFLFKGGPKNSLEIGKGQPSEKAAKLAAHLHSLCPVAHALAAIRAIEAIEGKSVAADINYARTLLNFMECTVSIAMKAVLYWPKALGKPATTDLVSDALSVQKVLSETLFKGDWTSAGSAFHKAPDSALTQKILALIDGVALALEEAHDRLHVIEGVNALIKIELPSLGDRILDCDAHPEKASLLEMSASLKKDRAHSVADLLACQIQGNHNILQQFAASLKDPDTPDPITRAMAGARSDKNPQTALGFAQTARGRLRHILSLREGHITQWEAHAPTDWNFAADGPFVRAANAASAGALDALVMAFDPCAPVQIHRLGGRVNA